MTSPLASGTVLPSSMVISFAKLIDAAGKKLSGGAKEDLAALRGRHVAPGGEGRFRGGEGALGVGFDGGGIGPDCGRNRPDCGIGKFCRRWPGSTHR